MRSQLSPQVEAGHLYVLGPTGLGYDEHFVGAAIAAIGNFLDQHHRVRPRRFAKILRRKGW